jgi:hypothetical protein
VRGFEFGGVLGAPLGGEVALEGLLEERLAIDAELPPRHPQTLLPGLQLAEQLLDLRHDPLLLRQRRQGDGGKLRAAAGVIVSQYRRLLGVVRDMARCIQREFERDELRRRGLSKTSKADVFAFEIR